MARIADYVEKKGRVKPKKLAALAMELSAEELYSPLMDLSVALNPAKVGTAPRPWWFLVRRAKGLPGEG